MVTGAGGDHGAGWIGKAYCVGLIDSLGWPSLDPAGGDRREGVREREGMGEVRSRGRGRGRGSERDLEGE